MEELIPLLKRIAEALDEQNRQTDRWFTIQQQWRNEGDPNVLRLLAMHEEQAARDQAWRDMNTKAIERFLEEQRQIIDRGLSKE